MTLLVNSTKKYGNLRKGVTTNGAMTFKHSMTKKIISSSGPSKQQFLSPPVILTKGTVLTLADKNTPSVLSTVGPSNAS
jgi:hypothetical protein